MVLACCIDFDITAYFITIVFLLALDNNTVFIV